MDGQAEGTPVVPAPELAKAMSGEPVATPSEVAKPGEGELTPAPPTYSQEQWEAREKEHSHSLETTKGGHKGTVDELKGRLANLEQAKADAEHTAFLKLVEDGGGDMNIARALIEREKSLQTAQQETKSLKTELDERQSTVESESKNVLAERLMKQHNLSPEESKELSKAKNPTEMEKKALELEVAKLKSSAIPSQKPSKPVATPGSGVDWKDLSPALRMAKAIEMREEETKNKTK